MHPNYWIIYNGITLKVLTWAQPYAGVAQFETNNTYLYTRHTLAARCVFNPFVNSFNEQRDFQGRPPNQLPAASEGLAGKSGIITHKNIKHFLMQPRQRLVLAMQTRLTWELNAALNPGTEVVTILESPLTLPGAHTFITDATNGPTPIHCDVIGMTGPGKSIIVDFVIQTDINECIGKEDSRGIEKIPVVLAHVWEPSHHIDDQFDTTRTIHGRAILRGDVMRARNIRPDDFRQAFFHPLPNGFKRDDINVVATEDGLQLKYTVVDRQIPWALEPTQGIPDSSLAGVSHIEAVHTAEIGKPSADDVLVGIGGAAVRTATRFMEAAQASWIRLVPAAARASGGSIIDFAISAIHLVPRRYHYITVRVYGDKVVSRDTLRAIADGVSLARIKRITQIPITEQNRIVRSWAGITYSVTDSLEPKYVEVTWKIRQAVSQAALLASGFNLGADINLGNLVADLIASATAGTLFTNLSALANVPMRLEQNIINHNWNAPGIIAFGDAGPAPHFNFSADDLSNVRSLIAPRNARATRGNYIASLVAQALSEPCSPPPTTLAALADSPAVNLANVDMTLLEPNPTQVR